MSNAVKVSSGFTQYPFTEHVGETGRLFYNADTGELRLSDGSTPGGVPVYVAVGAANIGNLVITNTTISTYAPNANINLQTNGTGEVNVVGSFNVTNPFGNVILEISDPGYITWYAPNQSVTTPAMSIIGTSGLGTIPVTQNGVMLQITGQDNITSRVYNDSAGSYSVYTGRRVNGTFSSPTALQAGDDIVRYGASGYDGTIVANTGVARVTITAIENFTPTAHGSNVSIWTTPRGTTTLKQIATFDDVGLTTLGNLNTLNIYATGISSLYGNVLVSGNLFVIGTTITQGTTLMIGNTTTQGTTNMIGNVITQGNLTVQGTTALNGLVNIVGNVNTTGASLQTGAMIVNGPISLNNTLSVTGTGNIQFNDGTVQTTATIGQINNSNHVTGSLGYNGNVRTLSLTTDAQSTNVVNTLVARDAQGNIAVTNLSAQQINTTAINGNNTVSGSMIIYGNLQVLGTTTTISAQAIAISSKVFTLSNNATTGSQADSSGIQVGNTTVFADFLYDNTLTAPAWRSSVDIVPKYTNTGNIGTINRTWASLWADQLWATQQLNVGIQPPVDYATVGQFTANIPTYSQVYNQNISNNNQASTDFVAANDLDLDGTNYIDMGINSSTYSNVSYGIMRGNDGYLYTNGGNLVFGTASLNSDIVFFTDGTLASNQVGRVHLGRWMIGQPTDDGVNRLQVQGNINVSGNILANTVTAWNITNLTNSTTAANIGMLGYVNSQVTAANTAANSANVAMKGYVDNSTTTANVGMKGYVDAVTTAWTANSYQQQALIGNLQVSSYSNVNLAAYLAGTITTGNISVSSGNVILTPKVIYTNGGVRTINGGIWANINFSADSLVMIYNPIGTVTVNLSNYQAGSCVKLIARIGTARNISLGVAGVNNTTTGAQGGTTITGTGPGSMYGANQTVVMDYTCMDNTAGNCYVQVSYV